MTTSTIPFSDITAGYGSYGLSPNSLMMQPESVAVLGGGLTGLSAAFHLSRRFPTARITIINKDARFGGWARSERVKFKYTSPSGTQEEANVLCEVGQRALSAKDLSVLELIHLLDLTSSVTVPKPSATSKKPPFPSIHIPGSRGIHRVPTSPLAIINPFQPAARLGRLFFSSVLLEPFRWPNRPSGIEDESVDAFFTRRFGAEFARVFGSVLTHGALSGDSRKLSMRALFPSLWDAEERGHGFVLLGNSSTTKKSQSIEDTSYELGDLQDKMHPSLIYSFKDGIGTLADALVDYLQRQPNVQMYGEVRVTELCLDASENRFKITTSSETLFATHVVSALPLYELEKLLSPATPLPHLTVNTYSSITVVHLAFPRPVSTSPECHPHGSTYIVVRPANGYSTTNGSGILGCILDPRSSALQDTTSDEHQGITKMTVMLGGPYYDISDPSSSPLEKVDIPALVSELSDQLDRALPSPVFVKVYRNVGCMPSYSVGHVQRMEELKGVLASEPWNGRMEVVGAGVAGASVGGCVEAGRNVGRKWGSEDGHGCTE